MALVNFLKFSDDCGAIISDEEYWNVFFRKRMHGDNLHLLLDPPLASRTGIQAVYGAVGYPSIHRETVELTRQAINEAVQGGASPERLKDIARLAFKNMQAMIRRRIDEKMYFYFGFKTEDLNRGFFQWQGKEVPISMKAIKEKARKLATRETKDTLLKSVLDTKAVVFGFDADGITGYHLSSDLSIVGYVHEGFEAIGSGKYASGLVFGEDFKAKTLHMRKKGYSKEEGVFELFNSAFLASEHFKEVGGNFHLILLDRSRTKPEEQIFFLSDAPSRLASEIVRAFRANLLDKSKAVSLVGMILSREHDFDTIEERFFSKVSNLSALRFLLRKYKINECFVLAESAPQDSSAK